MVDYVKDVRERQELSLQERLGQYNDSILILAHNGDIPEFTGFNTAKVETFADLLVIPSPAVAIIGDSGLDLAKAIGAYPEVVGRNLLLLTDVPGQDNPVLVTSELSMLRKVDYVRMLNDIADMKLREEHMSEQEKQLSKAKAEESRLRRKDGSIRHNYDFDRAGLEGEEDGGSIN